MKPLKITVLLVVFLHKALICQNQPEEYLQLMEAGEYTQAVDVITARIEEINSENVRRKHVPSEFISFATIDEEIDLDRLFTERVVENMFIEENAELHELHYHAGIAHREVGELEKSVSHLQDSLRYKHLEYEQDDRVFYQLAQTYKELNKETAYHGAMRIAAYLDPNVPEYSRELGISLYTTKKRRQSIYHLERYILLSGDEDIESDIYLYLAALYLDIGKYLKTQRYYQRYIDVVPDDGDIYFALGYLSYAHTGNFDLAIESLEKVLEYLEEDQFIQRSQCHEYIGDIYKKRLYYEDAVNAYEQAMEIEEVFVQRIEDKKRELEMLQETIDDMKRQLLKKNNYQLYQEYQEREHEFERLKREKTLLEYEYNKFNPGKRRWNAARCHEHLGNNEESIRYYEESIKKNYNTSKSREQIRKIRLKIRRGY